MKRSSGICTPLPPDVLLSSSARVKTMLADAQLCWERGNLLLPPLLGSPAVFPQKCHLPQAFNPYLHMHYLRAALGTSVMKGEISTKLPK